MRKKYILIGMLILLFCYPLIRAFLSMQILKTGTTADRLEESILSYQLSLWLTWIPMVAVAVYYKWTTNKSLFFNLTYGFLFIGFCFFGYIVQAMIVKFKLPSNFGDNYSLGVFTALQGFAVPAFFTAFLQAAVWWFTRRWHRR